MTQEKGQTGPVGSMAGSAQRARLAKVAEAFGWMRCERLGKEVWYDPTGGHVTWGDLPKAIEDDITELIEECADIPMRADDAAALEKLGNPFLPPNTEVSHGASLEWHKGPAEGGQGTAAKNEDGVPQWWDGDRLLIIVETDNGREIAVVDISADEDYFCVRDASTGDTYDAWGPGCWSWWAKLTEHNLPPNVPSQPRGE